MLRMGALATTAGLSFEDPWIVAGLAGIAATMGIGLGLITPTGKKLAEAAPATPPDGPRSRACLSG
jgi:hypothetical protein